MNILQIVQILINGLALGSVYALIATGFSVIFNVLNFAGVSVMSTVAAIFGPTTVMLAVFLMCIVAFAIAFAIPYRQIASKIRGDEEVAYAAPAK